MIWAVVMLKCMETDMRASSPSITVVIKSISLTTVWVPMYASSSPIFSAHSSAWTRLSTKNCLDCSMRCARVRGSVRFDDALNPCSRTVFDSRYCWWIGFEKHCVLGLYERKFRSCVKSWITTSRTLFFRFLSGRTQQDHSKDPASGPS